MKYSVCMAIFSLLMLSCGGGKDNGSQEAAEDNSQLVEDLQGVWLDDNTEMPILKVKGDSIYMNSKGSVPFSFSVLGDTLVSHGVDRTVYRIKRLSANTFQFYTVAGDLVTLHKSDNDALEFSFQEAPKPSDEVIKKDSVFLWGGKRYRGYVYINPSTRKVIRPGMTEEGLNVDNVYYDNVIHICVYQGRQKLFSKDISKDLLANTVPVDFLNSAILSDMDFVGVDDKGYHYRATVCIPDGMSCYYVDLTATSAGDVVYKLRQ